MQRNLPKHVPTTESFSPDLVAGCGSGFMALDAVRSWALVSRILTVLRDGWEPISEDKSGTFLNRICILFATFFVRIVCRFVCNCFHIFCTCFWWFFCLSSSIDIPLHHISEDSFFCGARGKKAGQGPKTTWPVVKSKAETGMCKRSTGRCIVLQKSCVFLMF